MRTRFLGRSGLQVPVVGYGTWRYQGDAAVIHRALDLGANLVDTAESYDTERQVGQAIAGRRDETIVATKVSASHFRHADVLKAADQSLRNLGVDTIDLYQLHAPSYTIPIEETMGAMDELVRAGKVRHVGVSNFSPEQMADAERALGPGRIVANQIKYSLFDHEFAEEVLPYCQEHGITVLAYSSLEQGEFARQMDERPGLREIVDRICGETGATHGQLLLAWVLHHPSVVTIPMTNRVERVDENCAAADIVLTEEQHAALAEAAGPATNPNYWWHPGV